MTDNIIGRRMKSIRENKDLKQNKVAKKLSVSPYQLSRYENGKSKPDPELIAKIATYYDVSTDYLLGKTDSQKVAMTEELALSKDEKDVAKRLEDFKKDLTSADGLNFSGEPMSDDAKESLIEAMDHLFRQTQRINKKYIPKKHRKDED